MPHNIVQHGFHIVRNNVVPSAHQRVATRGECQINAGAGRGPKPDEWAQIIKSTCGRITGRRDQTQNVEFDFAEVSNLLSSLRQQSPEVLQTLIPNYTAYSSNPGPAVSNADLLQLLTAIQHSIAPPKFNHNEELQLAESLRRAHRHKPGLDV